MLEDNINLIRKIAWSYVKGNPGLEFDDIFQESCLACLDAQSKYDTSRGEETTFYWHVVHNHLRTLLRGENKRQAKEINGLEDLDFSMTHPSAEHEAMLIEEQEQWEEAMLGLSREAQYIRELVVQEEEALPIRNPQKCKRQIANALIEQGWEWSGVWHSFREIKAVVV